MYYVSKTIHMFEHKKGNARSCADYFDRIVYEKWAKKEKQS